MASDKIQRITDLISEVRAFRFCGPSDDPDEQTAVCVGFRHLVVQLQRLASQILPETERNRLNNIEIEINDIYSVYDANAELETLLTEIEDALANVGNGQLNIGTSATIITADVIQRLDAASSPQYDTAFLVRLCKEINSCFAHGNVLATALTMRSVLNYIPPVFGHSTFDQVTAQSSRSLKSTFTHLQDGLRRIADFHAHRTIATNDVYPSAAQVEPYKPQFEILLLEVVARISPQSQVVE